MREAAENATFTLSEAACGRPESGSHTAVWTRARAANPFQSSLTRRGERSLLIAIFLSYSRGGSIPPGRRPPMAQTEANSKGVSKAAGGRPTNHWPVGG